MDYDALAKKFGGVDAGGVDYDALAAKFGATDYKRPADALDNPNDAYSVASGVGLSLLDSLKNYGVGAVKDATSFGNFLIGSNDERKASQGQFFQENADSKSLPFKAGQLTTDIAATAGVGGVLGQAIRAFPALAKFAPALAPALESGGFSLGRPAATTLGGKAADMATRVGAGAAVGGASAGLVDPDQAGTGAVIGGAAPGVLKAAGAAGKALTGDVSKEVFDLYKKARNLGIDIPADRIINSKPLDAVAASLNYVPLSGRSATENRMIAQMNRAMSRTMGQDSENLTGAVRAAKGDLGAKFESTLSTTAVKVDNQLLNDLAGVESLANKELVPQQAQIIKNQINEFMNKMGTSGEVDAQSAYNIKKTLDRLGNSKEPSAYYARELRNKLIDGLNRSLGPDEAAAFAKVRQQYGNMKTAEKLAPNGAEGEISAGRLANLKNIRNQDVQDIADIAAQFLKGRENPHGAAQRVAMTLGGGGGLAGAHMLAPATLPFIVGGMAAGRVANTALNSNVLKNAVLNPAATGSNFAELAGDPALRALIYNQPNRR